VSEAHAEFKCWDRLGSCGRNPPVHFAKSQAPRASIGHSGASPYQNGVFSFAPASPPCHCPGLYQIVAMAYAIIRSGNKQYRVSPGETVAVEKLSGQAGDQITFAEVVLHCDGDKVTLGAPLIDGAKVSGEVVEQFKDKKVIAFKYRRRKGYHRTVGHRRQLTRVKIGSIDL
jgi:large subunit ribosomal protein L21